MNIIFLDIDGVLIPFIEEAYNEKCIERITKILENTDAKIVLSSNHRLHKHHLNMFNLIARENGWDDKVIGITSDMSRKIPDCKLRREQEIKEYVKRNNSIEKWIVIDDMALNINNMIKTHPMLGLSDKDAEKAINILS